MSDCHHQGVVEEEGVWLGKEMEGEEGESSWNGKDLRTSTLYIGVLLTKAIIIIHLIIHSQKLRDL